MSSTMASGRLRAMQASASRPELAVNTRWPASERMYARLLDRIAIVIGDQDGARKRDERGDAPDPVTPAVAIVPASTSERGSHSRNSLPHPSPALKASEPPPVQLNDSARERQPYPETTLGLERRIAYLGEHVEHARQRGGGNSDAVVAHAQPQASSSVSNTYS